MSELFLVPLLERHGVEVPEPWRNFLNAFDTLRPQMRTIAEPPNDDDIERIKNFPFPVGKFRLLIVAGVNGAGKGETMKRAEPRVTPWGDCSPEFIRTYLRTRWKRMSVLDRTYLFSQCKIVGEDQTLLMNHPRLSHYVPSLFASNKVQAEAHARKSRTRELWAWAMQEARDSAKGGNPYAVVINLFTNLMNKKVKGAMGLGFKGMPDWEFAFLLYLIRGEFDFRVVYLDAEARVGDGIGKIELDMVDVVHLMRQLLPNYILDWVPNNGDLAEFQAQVDSCMPGWLRYIRQA